MAARTSQQHRSIRTTPLRSLTGFVHRSTLAKTERMSPKELEAYQAPLLSPLLLHTRKTTKFYKDRLDFDLRSDESIKSNWSDIPS